MSCWCEHLINFYDDDKNDDDDDDGQLMIIIFQQQTFLTWYNDNLRWTQNFDDNENLTWW